MNKVICLFGPTCSGKTSLSIEIAIRFGLSIISADSMQVYKKMDIGTAKIKENEMKGVEHHLINIRYPDEYFTTSDFFRLCNEKIAEIHTNNMPAFVVGGTGLYFKSLIYGMSDAPGKNDTIRQNIEKNYRENPEKVYNELKAIDPEYTKIIHLNDLRRITRALEIYYLTGKPITHFDNQTPDYDYLILGLNPEREALYQRINARCDDMVEKGLIEETQALIQEYGKHHYSFKAIGYSHAIHYLDNALNKDDFITLFKRDTRRFAKRQLSLFRSIKDVKWFESPDMSRIVEEIKQFIKN